MVSGDIIEESQPSSRALRREDGLSADLGSVAVVIPTHNHAHFLGEAIESVRAQTRAVNEIIVVDDGSQDDPAAVVRRFEGVRLIRQDNFGLAVARNAGLGAARSDKILFLDADDVLHPDAIDICLATFARVPDAGFVYGAHRRVDNEGGVRVAYRYTPVGPDPYRDFLKGNIVGMHATVLYSREKLLLIGGFNEALRRCEDYDVYLRLSKVAPVASHGGLVADYRWHGRNMSSNHKEMLSWVLRVHRQERAHAAKRPETAHDWQEGRGIWRDYYAREILQSLTTKTTFKDKARGLFSAGVASPSATFEYFAKRTRTRLKQNLPPSARQLVRRLVSERSGTAVGKVDFGDLCRTQPVSLNFGFDRGTPIDRYYIERFLAAHASDIRGRVLEVGDAAYCKRFGGDRITHQDVLHISPDAAQATIVGDLSKSGLLPEGAFDCLVLTQTLHLVYDMGAAVTEMHRALRSDGLVLLTVPGISQIDRGEWSKSWYWSLTKHSAGRLFAEVFGPENVEIEAYGNVFAATAFLQGIAVEEVNSAKLDCYDEAYPVTLAVRARKVCPPPLR